MKILTGIQLEKILLQSHLQDARHCVQMGTKFHHYYYMSLTRIRYLFSTVIGIKGTYIVHLHQL